MKLFQSLFDGAISVTALVILLWVSGDAIWGKGSGLRPWLSVIGCLGKNSCIPKDEAGKPISNASVIERVEGAAKEQISQVQLPTHPAVAACPKESVQDQFRVLSSMELSGIVKEVQQKKIQDQLELPQGVIACLVNSAGAGPVDIVVAGQQGTFIKLRQPKKDARGMEVTADNSSWKIPQRKIGSFGGGEPK